MDRNDIRLVGRIGERIKTGRTQNGGEYVWFPLEIEARANASSTENNFRQKIHVMCFKKPVIDYLRRVELKQGQGVVIFGFVSAFPSEIKGKSILVNAINANEIYVIKTKPDAEPESNNR